MVFGTDRPEPEFLSLAPSHLNTPSCFECAAPSRPVQLCGKLRLPALNSLGTGWPTPNPHPKTFGPSEMLFFNEQGADNAFFFSDGWAFFFLFMGETFFVPPVVYPGGASDFSFRPVPPVFFFFPFSNAARASLPLFCLSTYRRSPTPGDLSQIPADPCFPPMMAFHRASLLALLSHTYFHPLASDLRLKATFAVVFFLSLVGNLSFRVLPFGEIVLHRPGVDLFTLFFFSSLLFLFAP